MRILYVDDDEQARRVVRKSIAGLLGYEVVECATVDRALDLHRADPFKLILSDIRMPGRSGLDLLAELRHNPDYSHTDVIFYTGFADLDTAVAALRLGAFDLISKTARARDLLDVIHRWEQESASHDQAEFFVPQEPVDNSIPIASEVYFPDETWLGQYSDEMREIVTLALRLHEDSQAPVLIEGETGTGKEQVAKLVHHGRDGSAKPFVLLNCSALTPTLYESELFGHEPGAFTGARKHGAPGKLAAADGGTLFLDEIGEMPLELQPKLLHFLQSRQYYPVGGVEAKQVRVRIIAATNRSLAEMVESGRFRRDLFYRLNMLRIELPSLRRIPDSIGPLAQRMMIEIARSKHRRFESIHPDAVARLQAYTWPGNIRELRNVIERAILLNDAPELLPQHLPMLAADLDERRHIVSFGELSFNLPADSLPLDDLEREVILATLDRFDGNQSRASDYLGLSRYALKRRLEKYGLNS